MIQIQYRRDLWQVVQNGSGDLAEVGVAEGRFSEEMLSWPLNTDRLWMVDRWSCNPGQKGDGGYDQEWHDRNFEDAQSRVAKYGDRAMFLMGDSVQMSGFVPDHSLRLVYIDADHSYEGVKVDIETWFPKLKGQGVMAFHDYENPAYGVKRAVQEFCACVRFEIHLIPEDKKEDAGAWFQTI